MTAAERIIAARLTAQRLTERTDTHTAVRSVLGVQAQFLSHALHAIRIRCFEPTTEGLIKSWTTRGTMHLFHESDLPLQLHEGREHFLRPVDKMETDAYITAARKEYFSALILGAVAAGQDTREQLRRLCFSHGLTEQESKSVFDPWGGLIRALCEDGKLCHRVQEKKAYRICPAFTPMDRESAVRELMQRYFQGFGPATLRDAAYFFGITQKAAAQRMAGLALHETAACGEIFYSAQAPAAAEIPPVIFLAGFDQFLLGYDKRRSLCLKAEHRGEVFTRAGIVRPTVLVNGSVAAVWSIKGSKLTVRCLEPTDRALISAGAERLWGGSAKLLYAE